MREKRKKKQHREGEEEEKNSQQLTPCQSIDEVTQCDHTLQHSVQGSIHGHQVNWSPFLSRLVINEQNYLLLLSAVTCYCSLSPPSCLQLRERETSGPLTSLVSIILPLSPLLCDVASGPQPQQKVQRAECLCSVVETQAQQTQQIHALPSTCLPVCPSLGVLFVTHLPLISLETSKCFLSTLFRPLCSLSQRTI